MKSSEVLFDMTAHEIMGFLGSFELIGVFVSSGVHSASAKTIHPVQGFRKSPLDCFKTFSELLLRPFALLIEAFKKSCRRLYMLYGKPLDMVTQLLEIPCTFFRNHDSKL